jgi:hypothetical protein
METKKPCCGIDVSHTTLDVCYQNNLGEPFHLQVGNNGKGFEKILEHTGTHYHFVMEATGVYYIRLAFFLHQHGCTLSVVNALSIKRFIQMHLERNKSDRKMPAGFVFTALSSNHHRGKCPTRLTFRANNFTTLSVSTVNKSSGSITSYTAFACFLFKARIQLSRWKNERRPAEGNEKLRRET